jgi:hypothetical protein
MEGLRLPFKIGLAWNQIGLGFEVGEDAVVVRGVDASERGQQFAQIDLGAADLPGDEIQGVDADALG